MKNGWTPTAEQLPPRGVLLEWITRDGRQMRGTYAGVWFPEGSNMYVYYVPTFWREVADAMLAAREATNE